MAVIEIHRCSMPGCLDFAKYSLVLGEDDTPEHQILSYRCPPCMGKNLAALELTVAEVESIQLIERR